MKAKIPLYKYTILAPEDKRGAESIRSNQEDCNGLIRLVLAHTDNHGVFPLDASAFLDVNFYGIVDFRPDS